MTTSGGCVANHLSPLCVAIVSGSFATISLPRISRSCEASSNTSNVAHVSCRASAPLAEPIGQAKRLPYNSFVDRDAIMPGLLHSGDERFGFWKNHRLT